MIENVKSRNPNEIGIIFWVLFAINYLIMGIVRYVALPFPVSIAVEIFYIITIIHVCSSNKKYGGTADRFFSPLFTIYSFWLIFAMLELGNTTAEIEYGTIAYRWFAEVRTMGFQFLYGLLIFSAIFNSKEKIRKFHIIWGVFVLLAVGKALMQQYIGFDNAERAFLVTAARTHFVSGIIRYFSFFTDAANFGSNMAATVVVYAALAFTTINKKTKMYFSIVAVTALYGMMASGTRSAIIALAIGLMTFALLSRNIKAFISTGILGLCTVGFLMFTDIGQGNNMIRRMRSAFNKEDASLGAREINKIAMKRYLEEVPIGIGAGIQNGDVPPSNKNYFLSIVPPDSTWVYINIRYGYVGKFIFLFSFFGITFYGAFVTLKKVKEKEVIGIMAATVSGTMSMTIAGYSNNIMLQYPNCLLFFGTLGFIAVAEIVDKKAIIAKEEEMKKLLEKLAEEGEESLVLR